MGEHQILGLLVFLQGIFTGAGILVGFQTYRGTNAILQLTNETLLRVQVMSESQTRTAATVERIAKHLDKPHELTLVCFG
jgi:hypothetical protein